MSDFEELRRFRVVVTDEDSGEEVAVASGVETLIVLATPDTLRGAEYRRILVGDADVSVQLLFDVVQSVTERVTTGGLGDLDDLLDDRLLLDVTDGLTLQ